MSCNNHFQFTIFELGDSVQDQIDMVEDLLKSQERPDYTQDSLYGSAGTQHAKKELEEDIAFAKIERGAAESTSQSVKMEPGIKTEPGIKMEPGTASDQEAAAREMPSA